MGGDRVSAYWNDEKAERANVRHHWLGVAVLRVLVANREVAQFMDGDSVNKLADWCIANPDEHAIAEQLSSGFNAGYGRYDLGEWFPGDEAGRAAREIVAALAGAEEALQ